MKLLVIKKIFFSFLIIIFFQKSLQADEACNFKSSNFINELSNPKNIKQINIITPNSSKYAQNSFKIITSSKLGNIPKNLKKNIKANLRIIYDFGQCDFKAVIRQHGDWLDHIKLMNDKGQFFRSLDVKLKNGNILNNVRFKLLIPDTRNSYNEILGTILLKKLGFIAPETFEVYVNVNGFNHAMLFQESINKELLEKNKRREGPILEGDESYLWSYKNYPNFKLENVSLSKVVNEKWSLKGENYKNITLKAYQKLQNAYLEYSQNISYNHRIRISPNTKDNKIFTQYYLTMLALNGGHALRPHNRKFYYNSFEDSFEPIYYDGMMELKDHLHVKDNSITIIKNSKSKNIYKPLISSLNNLTEVLLMFKSSVINPDHPSIEEFFYTAIKNIRSNEKHIESIYNNSQKKKLDNKAKDDYFKDYIKRINKYNLDQVTLVNLKKDKNNIIGVSNINEEISLSTNDLAKIISREPINDRTFVLVQRDQKFSKSKKNIKILKHKEFGTLKYSSDISLDINHRNKEIKIFQKNKEDWILFNKAILDGWTILFKGINQTENESILYERINEYGFTGCLNFYDTKFKNTSIKIESSFCEDGLNIVRSKGKLSNIIVTHARSDAVDLDFSEIEIESINVFKAKNDCLDVSGGKYIIQNFNGSECGDKGISVGEKSMFNLKNFYLKNSNIAISSKDSSDTKIDNARIDNVEICYEVKQKKQEFDGAKLLIKEENSNCNEKMSIDPTSELIVKLNEL